MTSLPRWLVAWIVGAVSAVWCTNIVVGWVDPTRGAENLNWVFGLIIGGLLGPGAVSKVIPRFPPSNPPTSPSVPPADEDETEVR